VLQINQLRAAAPQRLKKKTIFLTADGAERVAWLFICAIFDISG
jgi:hypothetical protein